MEESVTCTSGLVAIDPSTRAATIKDREDGRGSRLLTENEELNVNFARK